MNEYISRLVQTILWLFLFSIPRIRAQKVSNLLQKHLRHIDNPRSRKNHDPSSHHRKYNDQFGNIERSTYPLASVNQSVSTNLIISGDDLLTKLSPQMLNYTQIILQSIHSHQYKSYDPYEQDLRDKFRNHRFFIYNLSEDFWWRWPKNGTQQACIENGYLGHEHAELSAIGRPLKVEDGLFLTWHFSMFNSLFNRLKRSSRRTYNPDEASLFIIPYDLGLDGYLDAGTCRNRRKCSEGLVGRLIQVLSHSKYFQRHEGADHVVLWSLGHYHPWPHAGCDMFMKTFCAKCTLTCYWMDPTKAENRFVSMPFPAAYHWWDGIQNVPWDLKNRHQRNLTAVYLGSTQTLNPYHTKIRRAMANQCNSSSECHWLRLAHSSIDTSIGDFLSVYKRSIFCLCPPGDDPARKAVFDAIVSGCIPVIFEVATLYNQYPWHIGEQAALDVSIYIPGGLVRVNKIDIMNILLQIKPEVIYAKQVALAELAPRVQYAIPPLSLLENRYDETTWDPPFYDAAEIAIDGFFERSNHLIQNESTRIPHRVMTGREWGQEYDQVKIQVPQGPLRYGPTSNSQSTKSK